MEYEHEKNNLNNRDDEENYHEDNRPEISTDEVLEQNEEIVEQYRKAGFWIRFWAYLIDVIIVSSVNAIVLSPFAVMQDTVIFQWEFISVMGILSGIVYYLYFFLMTKFFAQTLGKMIIGIKVISSKHQTTTWGDLFFREVVGRFLHNVFFILKLLYLAVAFTDDKQGIHDMIGDTSVVYAKS